MIEKITMWFESLTNMTFKEYFKAMKWIFIIGAIIMLIVLIIMMAAALLESSAPKDIYVIQGNSLPAFESVVGKRRGKLLRDEGDEIAYAFRRNETCTADVKKYVQSLQTNGGCTLLKESPSDGSPQEALLLKKAAQPKHTIGISIVYPHENQKNQDVFVNIQILEEGFDEALNRLRQ